MPPVTNDMPNYKPMYLKEYIFYLDSMTTMEFCVKNKLPLPSFTGDIETAATSFLQIDAIKYRLIKEYAKGLANEKL